MKANRIINLQITILAIALIFNVICCIIHLNRYTKYTENWTCDLFYRHNEIVCMHDGVDPFDIFERKITSEKYVGLNRPDKPDEPINSRKVVHSYPAWHAAVFWWYGYIPRWACVTIWAILNLCMLAWIILWTSHTTTANNTKDHLIDILFLFTLLYSLFRLYNSLNYGLLLLGCSLLLYNSLEYRHDILAGIIYSFIMIKPQVGLLFIIPLLINRKYKTISIAVTICVIETCFTAYMVQKSPIELIMQIPKLGAPYSKGIISNKIMNIVGPSGQYIVMGIFICIATGGCFLAQNAKEVWMRFLPAIAVIPFWTYSWPHDWLVTLPCYIYILNCKKRYPHIFSFCILVASFRIFLIFSHFLCWYSIGKEGTIVTLHLSLALSCCLILILDSNNKEKVNKLFSKLPSFGNAGN